MNPFTLFSRHPRGDLSAYIDGQLPHSSAARIDAHIASCEACAAEVASLRAVQSKLSELPEVAPMRSFALTPAQVADARPTPEPVAYKGSPSTGMATGLRLASAGIAVALFAVVLVDFGGLSGDDDGSPTAERGSGGDDSGESFSLEAAPMAEDTADGAGGAADGDDDSAPAPAAGDDAAAIVAPTPGTEDAPAASNALEAPADSGSARESQAYAADADAATADEMADDENLEATGELQDAEVPATGAPEDDDGDGSTLLIVEIALALALVASLIAAFVVSRSRAAE